MVVRSFFIQATNNFERMLSLGFLFALWPVVKKLYPTPEKRREAVIRHLSFFNTQPYFANCILGVVARAELDGGENLDVEVTAIKRAMMGAFGALGDDLFWSGLLPAAGLLALVCYGAIPDYAFIGGVAALVAYNVFHFWVRIKTFTVGLRLGRRVTSYLKKLRLPRLAVAVKVVASFLLGAFAVVVVWRPAEAGGLVVAATVAAGIIVSVLVQSLRVKPGLCWYMVAAAAVTVGALTA
jgi:mannose/fructose/N-acetylgalactosamine-specific phosphotransferase system component IID